MTDITAPDANASDSYAALVKAASGVSGQNQGGEEAPLGAVAAAVFAVGEYLVGDTEDTLLNGHPDIRY